MNPLHPPSKPTPQQNKSKHAKARQDKAHQSKTIAKGQADITEKHDTQNSKTITQAKHNPTKSRSANNARESKGRETKQCPNKPWAEAKQGKNKHRH